MMGHEPQQSTCAGIVYAVLACGMCSVPVAARAQRQITLEQAMLRTTSPASPAYSEPETATSTSVAEAFEQLAGQASVIFTGSVAAVQPDSSGSATVKFTVESGVRGVASGAGYTMLVSAWAGGAERYYTGERALFLLTAPSVSGYSAPVMGERGIVPLTGDVLVGNLDLRWVGADVQRGTPAQSEIRSTAKMRIATLADDAGPLSIASQASPASAAASSAFPLPDVRAIDRGLILDLLRTGKTATSEKGQER